MPFARKLAWDAKKGIRVVIFSVVVFGTLPTWAGSIIYLPIRRGGTVSYQAGSHHHVLRGTGIDLGRLVFGNGISSVIPILMGRLAFTTGVFTGSNAGWSMGPGGSFSVSGCVDVNHDHHCDKGDFRGQLMTGSFLTSQLVNENGKEVLEAQLVVHLAPQLAALLDLSHLSSKGELELVLLRVKGNCPGLRYTVQRGFLEDFPTVPEPASIVLLGASLAALGATRVVRALM